MKFTPLDIQEKQFQTGFRGFAREEVESFLEIISNEMEELIRENNSLREELEAGAKILTEYKQREKSINESIITAQKVTDEMKLNAERQAKLIISEADIQAEKIIQDANQEHGNAEKKAQLIISEAELQAERIVHDANQELGKIRREILNLKRQKLEFSSALQSMIDAHQKLLEMEKGENEEDEKNSMSLDEE